MIPWARIPEIRETLPWLMQGRRLHSLPSFLYSYFRSAGLLPAICGHAIERIRVERTEPCCGSCKNLARVKKTLRVLGRVDCSSPTNEDLHPNRRKKYAESFNARCPSSLYVGLVGHCSKLLTLALVSVQALGRVIHKGAVAYLLVYTSLGQKTNTTNVQSALMRRQYRSHGAEYRVCACKYMLLQCLTCDAFTCTHVLYGSMEYVDVAIQNCNECVYV